MITLFCARRQIHCITVLCKVITTVESYSNFYVWMLTAWAASLDSLHCHQLGKHGKFSRHFFKHTRTSVRQKMLTSLSYLSSSGLREALTGKKERKKKNINQQPRTDTSVNTLRCQFYDGIKGNWNYASAHLSGHHCINDIILSWLSLWCS